MNPYQHYMYSYPHKTAYRASATLDLPGQLDRLVNRTLGVYFHLPFCSSKCGYCNLFSVPTSNRNRIIAYIDALERHARQWHQHLRDAGAGRFHFDSLVLGGGTPLMLSESELERVFTLSEQLFDAPEHIVVETSPDETTTGKLKVLKEHRTHRVSIGVQSFVQSELDALRRHHSADSAERALSLLKACDFPVLNLDLIYGIHGQTPKSFAYSLKKALEYAPNELFLYPLYQQPGTQLHGAFHVDDYTKRAFYQQARDTLVDSGYHQLSMRRFAKKPPTSSESCGFENSIAIGCGGRTYLDDLHFCEPYTVDGKRCLQLLDTYSSKTAFFTNQHFFRLNEDEIKRRFAVKNILHTAGVDVLDYEKLFLSPFFRDFPFVKGWIDAGYAQRDGARIRLTPEGLALSDALGPRFISDAVSALMHAT